MRWSLLSAVLVLSCSDGTGGGLVSGADAGLADTGTFAITWTPEPGCPSLGQRAVIRASSDSAPKDFPGDPPPASEWRYEDVFACGDGGGTTRPLPLDTYEVSVVLADDSLHSLLAMSDPWEIDLSYPGEVREWHFEFSTTHGTVTAYWHVPGCADLGGESVIMRVSNAEFADGLESITPCAVGEATVAPVAIGDFDLSLSMRDSDGQMVGADFELPYTISYGNEHLVLGLFGF